MSYGELCFAASWILRPAGLLTLFYETLKFFITNSLYH